MSEYKELQSNENIEAEDTKALVGDEMQSLQDEIETLKRQCQQLREHNETLMKEAGLLRQKEWVALKQCDIIRQQMERLQVKYDTLANSKLGRTTLQYWNWKDTNGKTGALSFLSFLLFKSKTAAAPKPIAAQSLPASESSQPMDVHRNELAMTPEQEAWVDRYMGQLAEISDSNGCRYYKKLPYRIGLICDEFFYESISEAAQFVFVTPENWTEVLNDGLDAFLFVTAWRGLQGEWRGLGAVKDMEHNPVRRLAIDILDTCRKQGIPTVFYSKEDPPNYEVFLEYAKHCDHICTTASECIPYYQRDCERDTVNAISFGINPINHNPIGFYSKDKEDTVLFSGSWMLKYPDRCKELALIFDGIMSTEHGLHIIDRNYPGNKKYLFPEKYFPCTSPALPHNVLQKLHKRFDWAVNINSVKGSKTMFANRAFELQANGVLMMSNFSVGVNDMLPTVQMVQDKDEVARIMNTMTEENRYERQIAGVRAVMTGHTCFDRIAQILEGTGLETEQPERCVLVLTDKVTVGVNEAFLRQTYQKKVLMAVSDACTEDLDSYDIVAWFADGAEYDVFYLEDMINGFKYTGCDYVTKNAWYEGGVLHEGVEHGYVERMESKYRTVFWREAFSPEFLLNLAGAQALENGYSIDHFHYDAAPVARTAAARDYLLSVVIPVYNNGMHLYGKAFASLQRSSMFEDMEVLLIDGGSTDANTMHIETYLDRKYSNVRVFQVEDAGSGTISFLRNKGLEMASAPYVVFLNPESEAVGDGYAAMYELIQRENKDVVVGGLLNCAVKNKVISAATIVGNTAESNGQTVSFPYVDMHMVMVSRTLIKEHDLRYAEGTERIDELFFWQLMKHAACVGTVDTPVSLIYTQHWAAGQETADAELFARLYSVEEEKVKWLKESGLLGAFAEQKLGHHVQYLLKKLSLIREQDAEKGAEYVWNILRMYEGYALPDLPFLTSFKTACQAGDYKAAVASVFEAFPRTEIRPMLTLEELVGAPKVAMYVEYQQNGSVLTFENRTDVAESAFAWAVTIDGKGYKKVFDTKYSSDAVFTCDFSEYPPNTYKVRAFMKSGQEKKSGDIAVIVVDEQKNVMLRAERTNAINKGTESK